MPATLREPKFILLGLVLIYFISRLFHLTLLPIFTDEAIYIYWAKFIAVNHSHWFLSLTDGKPPVLTWIISIFLTIFPNSWYLIAGRLPSVIFGFITLIATYKLSDLLFASKKTAIVSTIFVLFSPYLLLYDRLALYDSQLTAMLIVSVYFMVKTSKTLNLRDAILWGFFLGLGFLSKSPALLFLLLTPVCFLLLIPLKTIKKHWKRIGLCVLLVAFLSQGMNNLQRISGAYQQALIKNQQFQQPLEELLRDPLRLTFGNMIIFVQWVIQYYTIPVFVAALCGFLLLFFRKKREGFILFILWFMPMLILATVGREIFPRYLLFLTPYAFIAVGYLVSVIWHLGRNERVVAGIVACVLLFFPLYFSFLILTDPKKAPLPTSDYNQLIAEHPSGYGLDRVFAYIRKSKDEGKVTVVTQGTFGLYPYAFYLEFWDDPSVRILPKWPLDTLDEEIYQAQRTSRVIVVLKEYKAVPPELHQLALVEKIEKPNSDKYPIFLTILR